MREEEEDRAYNEEGMRPWIARMSEHLPGRYQVRLKLERRATAPRLTLGVLKMKVLSHYHLKR